MADSPPRLQITDPNAAVNYAPISWLAVISSALGIFFIVAVLALAYSAINRSQPLLEPWLLGVALLAIVLAFVSRRQILASEGTLTGLRWSDTGWWIGVVGFLGYAAYLSAIEFSFRREVDTAFRQNWAGPLANLNVEDSKDPELYSAVFLTFPAAQRSDLSRKDIASIDRRFGQQVAKFRSTDLVKLASRNNQNITFVNPSIRDWQMMGTSIQCTLGVEARTPEGVCGLIIPMVGIPDERKLRQWIVSIPEEGYIKSQQLTLYGWWIDYLMQSADESGTRFMSALGTRGAFPLAYTGFMAPNADYAQAEKTMSKITQTPGLRAAVAGNLGGVFAFSNQDFIFPMPNGWQQHLAENIFAKPSGTRLSSTELATFQLAVTRPNTIMRGGTFLKTINDSRSSLILTDKRLEVLIPVDILRGEDVNRPTASKGILVLEPSVEETKNIRAELEKARASGNAIINTPPDDLKKRITSWRVTRILSDLEMLTPPQAAAPGGPGGPNMMGG